MLATLRRLLTRPDGIPHVTGHGITGSVSPLPLRGLDINPRPTYWNCCRCCETFAPAPCPILHETPCDRPECGQSGGVA